MEVKKRMQVNFRLDQNLLSAIQHKCKVDNISQTDFIIQALKKALYSDISTPNEFQQVISFFSLRLGLVESCLAENLAKQKSLLEKLASLEQKEEVTSDLDFKTLQDYVLGQLDLDQQTPSYKVAKTALSTFITELEKVSLDSKSDNYPANYSTENLSMK